MAISSPPAGNGVCALTIDSRTRQPGNAPAKRVGLLALISADCDNVPVMNAKARRYHQASQELLTRMGYDVITPATPTRTSQECIQHIRQLEDAGAEVLVMHVADWSYSTTAALGALLSNRLPIVLWTNAEPECHGLIGAAITKGALDEIGIEAPLVLGNFDDPELQQRLRTYIVGAAAARRLRGMRYGLGGTRSLEMLTASVDPNQWLMQFGVDVDGFDELDVVDRAKDVDPARVTLYKRWLHSEFGKVEVDDIVIDQSIALYVALKDIITEKRFDLISVKCLPVMAKVATSFCLAHALLGDASDADGAKERMVCACESDSNGALTMQMMKNIDDQAINFADVRNLNPASGIMRISNCGSQATEIAESRKDVHWVRHGLKELPWKHGGMCPQCVSKPGRVTMARLSRIKGEYVMLISGGMSLEKSRDALYTETWWEFSPHTFIKLDAPSHQFVNCLRSNHIHVMYGDWRAELLELCRVLGIRPIVPEKL